MASGIGSRFAALHEVDKDSHGDKKDKKDKKQAKDKKDKKEPKQKKDKKIDSVDGKSDDAAEAESKRKHGKDNTEAVHMLIVSILAGAFESFGQEQCREALDWLGLDMDAASIGMGTAAAADMLGKAWPRMLRHMASAVEGEGDKEGMSLNHLAELWSIGSRLSEDDVRCVESAKLQAALEKRFERSKAFRKAVQTRESRGKRLDIEFPPPATFEVSLKDKPLSLFGRPPDRPAFAESAPKAKVVDHARRCFAFYWPQFVSEEAARKRYFKRLKLAAPWFDLKRADESVKRSTCWYARGGCTCDYTYGSERIKTSAVDSANERFSMVMEELTAAVFRSARPDWSEEDWPNSANLNLYSDGSQSVGWHADDESLFMGKTDDCLIVSLSLGASREFWIALNKAASGQAPRADTKAFACVALNDGDLFTMEGLFQKHFLHKVPSAEETASGCPYVGERINVTWRWIRDHKRQCALSRGRQ